MTTPEAAVALAERWTPRMIYAIALAMALAAFVSGVLTTPAAPHGGATEQVRSTRSLLGGVAGALRRHEAAVGDLPTGLRAIQRDLVTWEAPPVDAWGGAVLYERTLRGGAVVYSLGADGLAGGVGDAADLAVVLPAQPARND